MFRYIPVIRSLFDADAVSHVESGKELMITFFYSVMPLIGVAALMRASSLPPHVIPFIDALRGLVSDGELILYSASFLAGTMYLIFNQPEGQPRFIERFSQGILVSLVIIASWSIYFAYKFDIWKDKALLVNVTFILFVFSLFLLYCSLVFEKGLTPGSLRSQEDRSVKDFTDRMQRDRNGFN